MAVILVGAEVAVAVAAVGLVVAAAGERVASTVAVALVAYIAVLAYDRASAE